MLSLTQIILCLFLFGISESAHDKHPVSFLKLSTCKEFDIHSSECQHFFPIESLKNYKSDKYKLHLKFYVMTTNDANVVLTNGKTGAEKNEYTAVVGGYSNAYSWLRDVNGTTIGLDSHKKEILSPLWPTPIVVTQSHDDELVISIPQVTEPLLKGIAKDFEVKSVCLYAWKADSRWFHNCVEDEDFLEAPISISTDTKVGSSSVPDTTKLEEFLTAE